MNEICNKLCVKANISIEKYSFLYNGNLINMDLTFEKQFNEIDKKNNQIFILVSEIKEEKSLKEKIIDDLIKKGKEILKIHLDGRSYKEPKVNDWIQMILEEFEQYFYQKYSSYNLFLFCTVFSKNTLYYTDEKAILTIGKEGQDSAVFNTDDLHSVLYFFFFNNFTSKPCPLLEPRVISYGNKLLYEIFDERKYGKFLSDCCKKLNTETNKYILGLDKSRNCLNMTFAFKKPLKDFSYNFKVKQSYDLARIIQTFITSETEIWHFLFLISNNK
jgi:hypothetical protein